MATGEDHVGKYYAPMRALRGLTFQNRNGVLRLSVGKGTFLCDVAAPAALSKRSSEGAFLVVVPQNGHPCDVGPVVA